LKLVYSYDPVTGDYKGTVEAQESPLEPGVYLDDIPHTIKVAPPEALEGFSIIHSAGSWQYLADEVIPEPVLSEAKLSQRALINSYRDAEEAGGFTYLGKQLDSDERSSLRITMAALTAQLSVDAGVPFSIDWTCKDNSTLTLNGIQTVEMPKYLAIHGLTLHAKAKALKTQVDNATTIEEVEAIVW
jgi:hypothetical protein